MSIPRIGFLLFAALCLVWSGSAAAQFAPFFDERALLTDEIESEKTILSPAYEATTTSVTSTLALRPFWSRHNEAGGGYITDGLYPIYEYRYKPETWQRGPYRRTSIFPLYFDRTQNLPDRGEDHDRLLLPFLFAGEESRGGRYAIVFPFIWYAKLARLAVPIFPPRPQSFQAIWPLYGDFHNFWNRDRITWVLWPLYVRSTEGEKGDPKYNRIDSLIWPVFGWVSGPTTKGFRVFPLYSRVVQDDEFDRGYFLWPLGHFRSGKIAGKEAEEQELFFFLPFYGKMRRPNITFDLVFPFYGRLLMKGRESRGYFLAIYNEQKRFRDGVKDQRLFWFLFRRQTPIPIPEGITPTEDPVTGGGFFPFYTRYHNETRERRTTLWPFGIYRWNRYDDYEFKRTYVFPFFLNKIWNYDSGEVKQSKFLFPVYRTLINKDGSKSWNVLHLFPYARSEGLDRNWAPLWTVYSKRISASGSKTVKWIGKTHLREIAADGARRIETNAVLFNHRHETAVNGEVTASTQLLYGLLGRHQSPDGVKSELLWMKF